MTSCSLNYDLHTHSYFSDGVLSPTDLVTRAHKHGVAVLALTDHDTTDGIDEASTAANALGVRLIAGIEISTSWAGHTIHVLGLRVDPTSRDMQEGIGKIAAQRAERARDMGRKLEKAGIPGAYEGACALAGQGIVTRTHFARFIVESGRAATMQQVFDKYLGQGKVGYVSAEWTSVPEAVGWIRGAGGQAVIAHPARYRMTATKLRKLIQQFKEVGGEGLEVAYGNYSPDNIKTIADHVRHFDLMGSRGSDFHGVANQYAEVGRAPALPGDLTPIWKDW